MRLASLIIIFAALGSSAFPIRDNSQRTNSLSKRIDRESSGSPSSSRPRSGEQQLPQPPLPALNQQQPPPAEPQVQQSHQEYEASTSLVSYYDSHDHLKAHIEDNGLGVSTVKFDGQAPIDFRDASPDNSERISHRYRYLENEAGDGMLMRDYREYEGHVQNGRRVFMLVIYGDFWMIFYPKPPQYDILFFKFSLFMLTCALYQLDQVDNSLSISTQWMRIILSQIFRKYYMNEREVLSYAKFSSDEHWTQMNAQSAQRIAWYSLIGPTTHH